jgi:hypothetical protein
MIRRLSGGTAAAILALALSATGAFAGNPAGSGQPGAECGDEDATVMPGGFTTGGFATAEERYAGNGASADHSTSTLAVSQYDVACYQLTLHAH